MKYQYGQFCPIAKAMEVLGERWTLLIVRELFLGAERFSELERGLPNISPTMLNRRLNELEACGILEKHRIQNIRGHRYKLTKAGLELESVLNPLGQWGMKWARGQMRDDELHVQTLMQNILRQCVPAELPGNGRRVIHFHFPDLAEFGDWWLKFDDDNVDLCLTPPGDDEDLIIETNLRLLTELWMGDTSLTTAINSGMKILGLSQYEKTIQKWLGHHPLAGITPAAHN